MWLLSVFLVADDKLHSSGNLEAGRPTSDPPASRYCSTGKLKQLWADNCSSAFTRRRTRCGYRPLLSREQATSI